MTTGGPQGCNIPVTGGTMGVNIAVANKTKGYYTDFMISVLEKAGCAGQSANFMGLASSKPLVDGDYLYQSGCLDAPSGIQWQSYHVWNISAYESLHGPIPE
jgi:hypothetical protein